MSNQCTPVEHKMVLPVSTAASLYWLGRYVVRANEWQKVFPFTDDTCALRYAKAFVINVTDAVSLNDYLCSSYHQGYLVNTFDMLKYNVQNARGVLSSEAFTAVRACSALGATDKNILHACNGALADEQELVYQFYILGTQVEMIDIQFRLNQFDQRILLSLYETLTQLPATWAVTMEQLDSFASQYNDHFYQWCEHLDVAFRGEQ